MLRTYQDIDNRITFKAGEGWIVRAESLDEVAAYGSIDCKHSGRGHSNGSDTSFYDSASYADAVQMMRHGWPEGIAQIKAAAARLNIKHILSQRPRDRYFGSVAPGRGMTINVPAVILGHPMGYRVQRPADEIRRGGRIVRVLVNVGIRYGISVPVIKARGAAIAAFVEALTTHGMSVGVDAAGCAVSGNGASDPAQDHMTTLWQAKAPGAYLNLSQLAFALLHPSSHRRINFAMREHLIDRDTSWGNGIGGTVPIVGRYPSITSQYDLVIDSDTADNPAWQSPEFVKTWIAEQLAKQGIIVA